MATNLLDGCWLVFDKLIGSKPFKVATDGLIWSLLHNGY